MKQSKIVLSVLCGFLVTRVSAMDSQFGYYQAQDLKVDINLTIDNQLGHPVLVQLRSNHFDKTFCPTKRFPIACDEKKDVAMEINGRCVYGKYRYLLTVLDSTQQRSNSIQLLGEYEESTINSIPVELHETYVLEQSDTESGNFCTIRKAK